MRIYVYSFKNTTLLHKREIINYACVSFCAILYPNLYKTVFFYRKIWTNCTCGIFSLLSACSIEKSGYKIVENRSKNV